MKKTILKNVSVDSNAAQGVLFRELSEATKNGKNYVKPSGYAFPPGTGPKTQNCGTCKHRVRIKLRPGTTISKCELVRPNWNHSRRTDILAGSPSCLYWAVKNAS